jgi:hypothetical protein
MRALLLEISRGDTRRYIDGKGKYPGEIPILKPYPSPDDLLVWIPA